MPGKRAAPTVAALRRALREAANPEKAAFYPTFFKTGPGQYGEGDRFIGVVVPDIRKIARGAKELPDEGLTALLDSPWHEERFLALAIITEDVRRAAKKGDQDRIDNRAELYLGHVERINNWDLVDISAPSVVGFWLQNKERSILYDWIASDSLWIRRIAIVGTLDWIKAGDFSDILRLSERVLNDPEDLIHKASGWMLREVGKKEITALRGFLRKFASRMPRTMLRYAIEKLEPAERRRWLEKRF